MCTPFFTIPRRILEIPNISIQRIQFFEIVWGFAYSNKPCFISNEEIAKRLNIPLSQKQRVNKLIKFFEDAGELKREYRTLKDGQKKHRLLIIPEKVVILQDYDNNPTGLPQGDEAIYINIQDNNPPIVPQKGDDVDQDDEKEKSFQEIWNMYPKKQAKQQAKKVWMRKTNSVTKYHEEIMKDLSIRLKTEWLEKDLKYIPMLSVYLNNRRWEDEYDGKPSLEQELNREYALYQLDCFDVDKKPLTKERWMTEIRGKS